MVRRRTSRGSPSARPKVPIAVGGLSMRRLATVAAVVLGVVLMASAGYAAAKKTAKTDSGGADGQFTDSLSSAVDQARANKKLIMLDFTGSDWCGYCIKLKEAVFDTQDF